MSNLGPVAFDSKHEEVFLGRDFAKQQGYSEAMAQRIDREIKRLVHGAYDRAQELLTEHRGALDDMAEKLLELETISRVEIEEIMEAHGIPARDGDAHWRVDPTIPDPPTDDGGDVVVETPEKEKAEKVPPLPPRRPVEQS